MATLHRKYWPTQQGWVRRGSLLTEPPPNQGPTASFTATTSDLRVSVNGSGSSDPDGTIASYAWDFGDNSTATGATASRTYATAGSYTVRLTVTDDKGATNSTTRAVTVSNPPVETWTLGETEPDEDNSGIGVLRPAPTTSLPVYTGSSTPATDIVGRVINGNITLTGNVAIKDCVVNGIVTTQGTNLLENNWHRGSSTKVTSGYVWLIRSNNSVMTTIRFCDIIPQTPSAHMNGVGTKHYAAWRCKVARCTDSFSGYSTSSTSRANKIKIQGCLMRDFVHWRPDTANNNREMTHNDHFQGEGNISDATDIIIEGCSIHAYHNTTLGTQPLAPSGGSPSSNRAAIMISPSSAAGNIVSFTLKNNWLYGGDNSQVNAGSSGITSSCRFVITGNRVQSKANASPAMGFREMNINPNATVTYSENRFMHNGALVPRP